MFIKQSKECLLDMLGDSHIDPFPELHVEFAESAQVARTRQSV